MVHGPGRRAYLAVADLGRPAVVAVDGGKGDLPCLAEVVLELLPHHVGTKAVHQNLVQEVTAAVELDPKFQAHQLGAVQVGPGQPSLVRCLEANLAELDQGKGLYLLDRPYLLEVLRHLEDAVARVDALYLHLGRVPGRRVHRHTNRLVVVEDGAIQLPHCALGLLHVTELYLPEQGRLHLPLDHGDGDLRRLRLRSDPGLRHATAMAAPACDSQE
mmetsp:Transcript_10818/g.24445  ORF Transcript_10818/g.24445 Transcript_10818/m.24445 type:complete len:216 (+) Transcript_10818:365-1012(+)